jgi:hypothetical protein
MADIPHSHLSEQATVNPAGQKAFLVRQGQLFAWSIESILKIS